MLVIVELLSYKMKLLSIGGEMDTDGGDPPAPLGWTPRYGRTGPAQVPFVG